MPHPLDPLSATEISAAVAVLAREHGVEPPRWRFGCIELREPAKDAPAARRARARGAAHLLEPRRRPDLQGRGRRCASDALVSWEHRPGEQANFTEDEFYETNEMLRSRPARDRGARAARRDRPRPRPVRHLGLRRPPDPRALPRPAGRLDRRVGAQLGEGEPLRQPDQRPDLRGGRELDGAARHRGAGCRRDAADDGRVRARAGARPDRARRRAAAARPPARRRLVRARRQRAELAALVDADRLQPARGPRDPRRSATRTAGGCARWPTACRSPRWWCPTATPPTTTCAARRSTWASGASGS